MHFNSLPDLPLRTIFGKLTLAELIPAGRVCTIWRSYQNKITCEVRSVTVLVGNKPLDLIANSSFVIKHLEEVRKDDDGKPMYEPQVDREWARLTYDQLDTDTVDAVAGALPGVTSIQIAVNGLISSDVAPHIISLLQKLSSELISVKLYLCFLKGEGKFGNVGSESVNEKDPTSNTVRGRISVQHIGKLIKAISKLPKLEHLTLDLEQQLSHNWNALLALDLSFIHRLREFYIHSWDRFYYIVEDWLKLTEVNENSRLEKIGCCNYDRDLTVLGFFDSHSLSNKFTTIPPMNMMNSWDRESSIRSLSTKLTSLNYAFHHNSNNFSFDQVLKRLAQLNQLIELKLKIRCLPEPINPDFPEIMDHFPFRPRFNFALAKYDQMEPKKIAILSSVKILALQVEVKKHSHIQSRHWAWIFPNVQVLDVQHHCLQIEQRITDCTRHSNVHCATLSNEQLTDSIRELLQPFNQCPKLHTIHTNFPQTKKWTLEQIQ